MHLLQAQPEFRVRSLPAAVAFYRDTLGFELSYLVDEVHAVMKHGQVRLHLNPLDEFHPGSCQILVDDIAALHAAIRPRAQFLQDLHHPPWGGCSFVIADPDGNSLCFAQWDHPPPDQPLAP